MTKRDPLTIWAVSDGRTGMENQALGLAEAIARQTKSRISLKRLKISLPYDKLPTNLWGNPFKRLHPTSDTLVPPLPDLWIACGRRTIPFSRAMVGKGPFVVQTQDPNVPSTEFDLVIPPQHDILRGDNVIPILGAPNRLTEEKLEAHAAILKRKLGHLSAPFVAVMVGGNSKDYRLTDQGLTKIISILRDVTAAGYTLLISPSRRTGTDNIAKLKSALAGPKGWVWDGEPMGEFPNPYFGMLGLAERVFVTEESANMVTDAAFTGKPLHLLPMEGGAPKWERFKKGLAEHGIIRPNAPWSEDYTYAPLRETDRAATEVLKRMGRI